MIRQQSGVNHQFFECCGLIINNVIENSAELLKVMSSIYEGQRSEYEVLFPALWSVGSFQKKHHKIFPDRIKLVM